MSKGTGDAAGPDGRLAGDLLVLRRVHDKKWIDSSGKVDFRAFALGEGGRLSVHVDGLASAAGLRILHKGLRRLFAVSVCDLRENGFGVELRPDEGDPSHADIFILPGGAPEKMGDTKRTRVLFGLFSRRHGMIFKR